MSDAKALDAPDGVGWIPVGERLPENHAWVLVYADGAINCMGYTPEKGFEDWTLQQAPNIVVQEIAYWRPLPDVPTANSTPSTAPLSAQSVAVIREALAEYAHEAWAGWMEYLFSKGDYRWTEASPDMNMKPEKVWIMPEWAVKRWQRQMRTPYSELSDEEKNSDREEADKMLAIINAELAAHRTTARGEGECDGE